MPRFLFAGCALLVCAATSLGSGTGTTPLGHPAPGLAGPGSRRYEVALECRQGLLVGRTVDAMVESIVVQAPGAGPVTVILAEESRRPGELRLVLSGPPELLEHTRRMTLTVRSGARDLLLYEAAAGGWLLRRPTRIPTPGGGAVSAFSVEGPGTFQLIRTTLDPGTLAPPSGRSGSLLLGLSHWVIGVVLLLGVRLLSRLRHRADPEGSA